MDGFPLSAREWSQQFETIKRQVQTKRVDCSLKITEVKEYMASLMKLDSSLKAMSVAQLEYEIAYSEIVRRQVVLGHLMNTLTEFKASKYSPNMGTISREESKKDSGSSFLISTEGGLKLRQKEALIVQEEMLLDLSKGIDKLFRQAVSIGDESKFQVRLLDALDDDVEAATGSLQAESRHADAVRGKSDLCWLYICIAIELVVVVVLLSVLY